MRFRDCLILIALAFATSSENLSAAGANAEFRVLTRTDGEGTAYTVSGKTKIEMREVRIESLAADKEKPLSVLVLFAPQNRTYSWRIAEADSNPAWRIAQFKNEQAVFSEDDELVDFSAIWYRLLIRVYRGHAANLNDAEKKALDSVRASTDLRPNLDKAQGIHAVDLKELSSDFMSEPMSAVPSKLAPTVVDVRWDGRHWTVILKARWTAEVVLDSDFKLISMRKVGN